MTGDLNQYLQCKVELIFPPSLDRGKKKKRILPGIFIRLDQEMYIVSPLHGDSFFPSGSPVTVNLYQDDTQVFTFSSVVERTYPVENEKKQIFVVEIPKEYQPSTQRSKPRVDTKAPGLISLHSLKGTIFPLQIRKKTVRAVILDLSETGAQVATNLSLLKEMRITITFFSKYGEKIILDADILWSKEEGGLYRYGIHFISPSPRERFFLRKVVLSQGNIIGQVRLPKKDP